MESPDQAAQRLYNDLRSKNKEETTLNIIMNNNLKQRIAIAQCYSSISRERLYDDIKKYVGGDYGNAASLMFLTPLEFCIETLKLAIKDKDDVGIFEMLTARNPEEIKLIKDSYKKATGKDLENELENIYKPPMKQNVKNLLTTARTVNPKPNPKECERYANTLIDVKESNWLEEGVFKDIFLKRSPEELILIGRYYLKKTKNNLIDVIDKKFSKQGKTVLKEILYNNIMPHELFTDKIKIAVKGLGTDENLLSRALISRCELDMPAIRKMYQYKYKVLMKDDIIDDTSGYYQKLCVYLGEK